MPTYFVARAFLSRALLTSFTSLERAIDFAAERSREIGQSLYVWEQGPREFCLLWSSHKGYVDHAVPMPTDHEASDPSMGP